MLTRKMPDFRQAVIEELKRRGWSNYRLVQELKGKRAGGENVPSMTIYQFLTGKNAINSTDLGLIADALGMELKRKK